jgi:D-glycero-D-manno-heptose 1,7-bisphosphate phosphatase
MAIARRRAALPPFDDAQSLCGGTIRACARRLPPRRRGIRPAVFLDRDGTLIVDKPYNSNPRDIEVLPGVVDGLRLLADAGYLLVVVTNQSGVARGYYDEDAVVAMHRRLGDIFAADGVAIAAYYFCPHHVAGAIPALSISCAYRKPGPGMLLRAAADWRVDLGHSWLIGDQPTDAAAAHAAGCRAFLMGESHPGAEPNGFKGFKGTLLDAARFLSALDGRASPASAAGLRAARRH